MFYKRFNFLVILRLVLIMLNFVLISTIFGDMRLFFNQIILSVILVIQVAELLRFINQTNRELSRLFLAVKHSDFSISFKNSRLGSSFRELQHSMSEIIESYKQVKIEKEGQFHFLQLLVNQINVGIISLEEDDIKLMNPTAELMLQVSGIKNWKILQQLRSDFTQQIEQLEENSKTLIEIATAEGKKFISIHISQLTILHKKHKLITFQDINSEIEQKEIEAWHKLIRILTHEIMNSVTPIASLTETMEGILQTKEGNQKSLTDLTNENIADIRFSLHTIRKRSDGLLNFIEHYRKLTKVPKPVKQNINIKTFFADIEKLLSGKIAENNIIFKVITDKNLCIEADPVLIEQVLINLLTNSMHAVETTVKKEITVSAVEDVNNISIVVHDTGKGINKKELPQIFVPFFSTKKDGSGIGLSLSKQIMSLHNGTIQVNSEEGKGTEMILKFRK